MGIPDTCMLGVCDFQQHFQTFFLAPWLHNPAQYKLFKVSAADTTTISCWMTPFFVSVFVRGAQLDMKKFLIGALM